MYNMNLTFPFHTEHSNFTHDITDIFGNVSVPLDYYFNGSYPYHDVQTSELYVVARVIRNIYIPTVSCIGLVGNTISCLVFSSQRMKKSSSSVFLAALAVVDNIFLVSLLLNWINGQWIQLIRSVLTCQLLVFTTYVSSFLSVWLVVSLTYERFFAISFPLKINYLCSVYREKVVVLSLLLIACVLYHFCFWTVTTRGDNDDITCSYKLEYFEFLSIVTWCDTAITMVIPFCAILFGNIKVVIHVIKCTAMSNVKYEKTKYSANSLDSTGMASNVAVEKLMIKPKKNTKSRINPQLRVTRTLLLVSSTFLVLNLPSHIVRLYSIIITISSSQDTYMISSPTLLFIQEITYLLYYTTFSCNFVLYAVFGRNFQQVLRNMIACKSHKQNKREIMLFKLSSGR